MREKQSILSRSEVSLGMISNSATSIAEVLELLRVCEEADGSVGGSALHLGSRILSVLFCLFLA
jgi:hypothetical protein